jgi:salicylate hydroxylase
MELGRVFAARYAAPYVTIHRADLQHMLLEAAGSASCDLRLQARVASIDTAQSEIALRLQDDERVRADALVAADGVWSAVREAVIGDGAARPSGHIAYRALVARDSLSERHRTNDVNLWLGPHTHVVAYPVRRGQLINVVAIVEARQRTPSQDWDQAGQVGELLRAMAPNGRAEPALRTLLESMPAWRVWTLHGRRPVASEREMAQGRVALVGDAAHPMLPYLAQGAGMAIEDAEALGRELADVSAADIPAAFARYASGRWRRCAQVQSRALRNARIFHAHGVLRLGRDMAMRLGGERLLDQPWLYGH